MFASAILLPPTFEGGGDGEGGGGEGEGGGGDGDGGGDGGDGGDGGEGGGGGARHTAPKLPEQTPSFQRPDS